MHPLDLSPKTNPSHFKSYSGDLRKIDNLSLLHKDNNKKTMCTFGSKREKDYGKRGRPRADILTTLMVEGSSSRSKIRCNKCGRVFPREKSLQAHLRTHTGERPYTCDFPGCTKAFCQSGQLKTHQRLHTGEKPFVCNITGCTSRFTHANRHCSTHPNAGLSRTEQNLQQVATQLNQDLKNSPEKEWLERYIRRCKDRLLPKSDTIPLDMRKQSSTSPKDVLKRKSSSSASVTITSTDAIRILPSPSPPKEDYREVFFAPLPSIPPFSSVSTPSRTSPVVFPVSPPLAHQSGVTLTPLTPRHPGSASTISSRSSLSSASSSKSSSSSGAVRDLSSFMHTPTKPSSYRASFDNFNSSPYFSHIITDHTSYSPYYGQVIPPPPSLSRPQPLTHVQIQREVDCVTVDVAPVKSDKDRYISALALIELSKG